MKSLAVAIALTTAFAFSAYAGTGHSRHIATSIVHSHHNTRVIPNGGVYLLENRPPASAKQVPNFQDNFAVDY
jgi:hypothetical protein